jgi:hypothetical protein
MKRHDWLKLWWLTCALGMTWVAGGVEADTNRMSSVGFRAWGGFGIGARFGTDQTFTPLAGVRWTPNGDAYNYNNGYVLTDSSGNAGGQTWYWGYDAPSQIDGNTILMSRSTLNSQSQLLPGNDSGMSFGGEVYYTRTLLVRGELRYGIEAGLSYVNVSLTDGANYTEDVTRVTDAYPYTPGTTPPLASAGYQGTFGGPGFLLGSSPSSTIQSVVAGGALVSGERKFAGNVFGLRFGPSVEFPVFECLQMSLSGGFALGFLDGSASWNETASVSGIPVATSTGAGNTIGLLYGGYLSGRLGYQFTPRWRAEAGVHYQNLGTYAHVFSGRTVEVDFSKSLFVTLGVGWNF